jgi:ubiquinone/menaquinone biosynthesis C-methylase UbiE
MNLARTRMTKIAGNSFLQSRKGRLCDWASVIMPGRASSSASLPVDGESSHRNPDPPSKEQQQQQQENEWNNPDGASDPNAYVRYLDGIFEGMSSSGPVVDYKRTVYELMEIRGGDAIIDIGCGTGADVLAIAELLRSANKNANDNAAAAAKTDGRSSGAGGKVSKAKVVGVDISDTMVRAAQGKLSKSSSQWRQQGTSGGGAYNIDDKNENAAVEISFCIGNAENLGEVIPSDSFDICRCDRSLQHVPHPPAAINEMVRITKPGVGRIVISEPDWETLVVDSPSHAKTTRSILQHFTDTRVNGWMGRQLQRLLKNSVGVENVRVLPMTSPVNDLGFLRDAYLDKARRLAIEASVVTEQEASDWMEELVALDEADMFFSTLTIYVARGNVC